MNTLTQLYQEQSQWFDKLSDIAKRMDEIVKNHQATLELEDALSRYLSNAARLSLDERMVYSSCSIMILT